ncbi:MAG TPA: tRNA (guanosine(37)-N1)-methyltransferase TrmD [Flavobacteriales bacterium]|nr:tRNA (guanosine(37)-N1)-methyltransferase TrmD [Flavobacteriales bacterium]
MSTFAGEYILPVRIDILTALPDLLQSWFGESILQRARTKGLVEVHVHDLRQWSTDKHRRVDDYPFGGGAGMVMTIEPIHRAIEQLKGERAYEEVIYLSPDGALLDQALANQLSTKGNIIMLCGHYKGVDERVREHLITREVSIGDYVLTGGELAAAVLSDTIIRLVPGVLGDETSALSDSFQDGLVAPPDYTRPADYQGWKVPDILLSGHQANIDTWRHQQALERTKERRPDLHWSGEGNDPAT